MQFLYPNVFFMMLIPLVLLIVLIITNKSGIDRYFSKEVLDRLVVGGKTLDKTTRNGLFFITLILFIIALGRPVMDHKEQELKQNLIPIVIALDVSKSMMATDIYPNRIELAKKKLKAIINLSKNSTIGILLFAKDSFILSPVTEDFISLNYIVQNLDTNLDFVNGSNIEAVLEGTSHMLNEFKVKNLIILSDGGNDKEYSEALEFAKDNEISIYSVGIATKKGAPIPIKDGYMTNNDGNIVTVKLNESIKNLALNSGGGYIDFTLDNSDIKAIISKINQESKKEQMKSQKVKIYTELFYFPLALSLLTLLMALSSFPTKNKTSSLILFVSLIFTTQPSYASIFQFDTIQKADNLYQEQKYKEASDEYRKIKQTPQSLYNLANSLYKDKKYKEAIDTYNKIITKDTNLEYQKLHNIANSYVNQNNLEKAKEYYTKALKLKDDKETKENLEMVNKELEKQKENKENKEKNNSKENEQQKDKQNNEKNKEKNKNKKDEDKQGKDKKNTNKGKKEEKKDEQKQTQSSNNQQAKKDDISDMEEKKWMKILNKKETPILLQKVQSTKGNTDETQPW